MAVRFRHAPPQFLMPQRIIICPNKKFAIFSTVVDNFVAHDMTENEVVGYFVKIAMLEARKQALRSIEDAKSRTQRWVDCLSTIESVHGTKEKEEMKSLITGDLK